MYLFNVINICLLIFYLFYSFTINVILVPQKEIGSVSSSSMLQNSSSGIQLSYLFQDFHIYLHKIVQINRLCFDGPVWLVISFYVLHCILKIKLFNSLCTSSVFSNKPLISVLLLLFYQFTDFSLLLILCLCFALVFFDLFLSL